MNFANVKFVAGTYAIVPSVDSNLSGIVLLLVECHILSRPILKLNVSGPAVLNISRL